ncbi:unnamed protein product [Aphanomyces euteiches]
MGIKNDGGERLPLNSHKHGDPNFAQSASVLKRIVLVSATVLLLTLGVVATQITGASPLSPNEPFCDSTAQSSGYIKLPNKEDTHYFYWFFESRSDPEKDPLVLWLTGGAGGSSMLALLTENGPCTVADDGLTTVRNPYSWTNNASVIWLDQPTGTGFSYGTENDFDHDSIQAGTNMYYFLRGWLKAHPKFINHKFFVTGESYAGHYIPSVASKIVNTEPSNDEVKINLQGIAIGNALTSPLTQMKYEASLMQNNSYGKIVLNGTDLAEFKQNVTILLGLIEKCYANDKDACIQGTTQLVSNVIAPIVSVGKVNQYDLREDMREEGQVKVEHPKKGASNTTLLPDDVMKNIAKSQVSAFLNNVDVQARLGVPSNKRPIKWAEIAQPVMARLLPDFMKNYESFVADVLEKKIRVLIYAGDADLVANWVGNHAWTNELEWSGKKAFNAAQNVPFNVDGNEAGSLQAANNFAFLRVFNAGHMVPQDQPEVSLTMVNRFFADELVQP